MNKTKIDWCDESWNPVVGCLYGCWYCYAKKLAIRFPKNFPNGFEPTFYPERLAEPYYLTNPTEKNNKSRKEWIVKRFPNNWLIFACSVSDLFAEWTKPEWRNGVMKAILENPQIIFQLLTKQPQQIDINYKFPDNVWLGVTVTDKNEAKNIDFLRKLNAKVKFVSFEPLLDWIYPDLRGIDWIIIGKLTGSKKIPLNPKWVRHLIKVARKAKIPIFVKENVKWDEVIREFP